MKKIVLLSLVMLLASVPTHAQLGGLIQKAAAKTAKTIEKKADSVANAAASALDMQFDKQRQSRQQATAQQAGEEEMSYATLMRQLPELPTAQQLCAHKEAELNEQALRLLSSAVTRFNTQVLNLSMKVASLATKDLDSAKVVDAAYKWAHLSTGMTKEE